MYSEAMIPSTIAQRKETITPMLMKMIAAMSFKERRKKGEEKNTKHTLWSLYFIFIFTKSAVVSCPTLTIGPPTWVHVNSGFLFVSSERKSVFLEHFYQGRSKSQKSCPRWDGQQYWGVSSSAASGLQDNKGKVRLPVCHGTGAFWVIYGQREGVQDRRVSLLYQQGQFNSHTHSRKHTHTHRGWSRCSGLIADV